MHVRSERQFTTTQLPRRAASYREMGEAASQGCQPCRFFSEALGESVRTADSEILIDEKRALGTDIAPFAPYRPPFPPRQATAWAYEPLRFVRKGVQGRASTDSTNRVDIPHAPRRRPRAARAPISIRPLTNSGIPAGTGTGATRFAATFCAPR